MKSEYIVRESNPSILPRVVDGTPRTWHRSKHNFTDIVISRLIAVCFFHCGEESVGTEFVFVQQSSQKHHNFSVVLLIHGDEQDRTLNDAKMLNYKRVT
jgi:hypothetical protein